MLLFVYFGRKFSIFKNIRILNEDNSPRRIKDFKKSTHSLVTFVNHYTHAIILLKFIIYEIFKN